MASLIFTSSALCSTSTSTKLAVLCPLSSSSSSLNSYRKTLKYPNFKCIPLVGLNSFSQWSGLKHLGISIMPNSIGKERKGRRKGKVVVASLFGVGAPEVLVIGVVALLVFGPKGLAEVARNLGRTLREFQPTIKELQEVSREFKSTLEREIGLDETSSQMQNTYSSNSPNTVSTPSSVGSTENFPNVADPNGSASPNTAHTSEEYLKIIEGQLKVSAAEQQLQTPLPEESQFEPQTQPQETASAMPPPQTPDNEAKTS